MDFISLCCEQSLLLDWIFLINLIYNPPFLLWCLHPAVPAVPWALAALDPPVDQNQVNSISYITATQDWVTAKSHCFSKAWQEGKFAPVAEWFTMIPWPRNDMFLFVCLSDHFWVYNTFIYTSVCLFKKSEWRGGFFSIGWYSKKYNRQKVWKRLKTYNCLRTFQC